MCPAELRSPFGLSLEYFASWRTPVKLSGWAIDSAERIVREFGRSAFLYGTHPIVKKLREEAFHVALYVRLRFPPPTEVLARIGPSKPRTTARSGWPPKPRRYRSKSHTRFPGERGSRRNCNPAMWMCTIGAPPTSARPLTGMRLERSSSLVGTAQNTFGSCPTTARAVLSRRSNASHPVLRRTQSY